MNPFSQAKYLAALQFAATQHGAQLVPGSGHPYVVHLASVAMEVIASLISEPSAHADLAVQCALLHDCLEDTDCTADTLGAKFGADVLAGVQALTKNDALPKEQRMADSLARLKLQPLEVQRVKLADRITNLQPPPEKWPREKRIAYREEALVIQAAVGASSPYLSRRILGLAEAYRAFC